MISLFTVKLGCVLLNEHINVSHVVYFCTIVLKGHFILMVTALISNIFRHQKSAIMVHFVIEGKNIAEKNRNFLITHVFINNQTMFSF